MTRLTSATVEGFKGIDRIEVDPGSLTVVTGRNNTGKTSLLEALDLAYDPSAIARFGPNLDTLINREYERALIEVETTKGDREVRLERPAMDDVPDLLLRAFRQQLERPVQQNLGEITSDGDSSRDLDVDLAEVLAETANAEQYEEARDGVLNLVVDGDVYPYLYFGETIAALYIDVAETVTEKVDDDIVSTDELYASLNSPYVLGASEWKYEFLDERPASIGATNFVDFNQLTNTLDFDEDDADPVKVDDIGDFVREHEILDDLKTFDVDHLVFEPEDGEKYSVPFEFMGEGFKTIVGVLWELLDDEDDWDLVLLEEPETHMHPGYVRQLVYFLVQLTREEGLQLFVTTHNNDFLNDFFEANFTDEEQSFLEDEFQLLQLQDGTAKAMDYADAEADLKELELDLRGL